MSTVKQAIMWAIQEAIKCPNDSINDIAFEAYERCEENIKHDKAMIEALEKQNKELETYKEYSYYVGTEIMGKRIPLKYSPWLQSLPKVEGKEEQDEY